MAKTADEKKKQKVDKKKGLTPLKAIKEWCLNWCQGGSTERVKKCPATYCVFWKYREGHNPKRKGVSPDKRNGGGKFVKQKKKIKRMIITGKIEEVEYEKQ